MKKAVVFNLGCKVNQCECDVIKAKLAAEGYDVFSDLIPAELYVINTCAVTAEAERKSRQILSRVRKLNPNAEILVCGCASQKNPDFYMNAGIKTISGVAHKTDILDYIGGSRFFDGVIPTKYEEYGIAPLSDRTRAYVKIQDGCNNFCSYCIIPYMRGRSRSRLVKDIVPEVRKLAETTKEIVITGINLSAFGKDTGESLPMLLHAIKDVDVRIRLGSFYVEGVTPELMEALGEMKHFCPHFHLSLQHGDADVLKSMNRHYTPEEYLQKVAEIRKFDVHSGITTDIIVGYPTETDAAFQNLLEFTKEAKFSAVHVFPFSRREGTAGWKTKALPGDIIDGRKHILQDLANSLSLEYHKSLIGIPQTVLFEEQKKTELPCGYSEYYVRIYADSGLELAKVNPTTIYKDGLKGEITHD